MRPSTAKAPRSSTWWLPNAKRPAKSSRGRSVGSRGRINGRPTHLTCGSGVLPGRLPRSDDARFNVNGGTVTLVMPPGQTAHPQVSVDGQPIILHPDTTDPTRLLLARRLALGSHQVLLRGAFAVDGLIIE